MAQPAKIKPANGPPAPTATKATVATRAPGGASGKREGFNLGKTWLNPDTNKQEILPPLIDYVVTVYEVKWRHEIVQDCQLRYQCSPATVDRAIAKIKAGFEEVDAELRAARRARIWARQEAIYHRAMRKDDLNVARAVTNDQAEMAGIKKSAPAAPPAEKAAEMSESDLEAIVAKGLKAAKAEKPAPKPKPAKKKKKAARGH